MSRCLLSILALAAIIGLAGGDSCSAAATRPPDYEIHFTRRVDTFRLEQPANHGLFRSPSVDLNAAIEAVFWSSHKKAPFGPMLSLGAAAQMIETRSGRGSSFGETFYRVAAASFAGTPYRADVPLDGIAEARLAMWVDDVTLIFAPYDTDKRADMALQVQANPRLWYEATIASVLEDDGTYSLSLSVIDFDGNTLSSTGTGSSPLGWIEVFVDGAVTIEAEAVGIQAWRTERAGSYVVWSEYKAPTLRVRPVFDGVAVSVWHGGQRAVINAEVDQWIEALEFRTPYGDPGDYIAWEDRDFRSWDDPNYYRPSWSRVANEHSEYSPDGWQFISRGIPTLDPETSGGGTALRFYRSTRFVPVEEP